MPSPVSTRLDSVSPIFFIVTATVAAVGRSLGFAFRQHSINPLTSDLISAFSNPGRSPASTLARTSLAPASPKGARPRPSYIPHSVMPRAYTSAAGVDFGSPPKPPPFLRRSSGAVIAASIARAGSSSSSSSSSEDASSIDSHTGPGAIFVRRRRPFPRAASGSYDSMTASATSSVVAATLAIPAPIMIAAAVSLFTFFFVFFIPYSPSLASPSLVS
mmetsp:Transcript_6973/g.30652  ORF Transcript_6973/g.30652 Transcript_6973/m.30652 type:complete len:217 (+) Transcript_6973:795-1445(+)